MGIDSKKVIKKTANQPLMRDYWHKFRGRTYITITAAQCATALLAVAGLAYFGFINASLYSIFGIALVFSIMLNIVTIWLIHKIGEPFHDLVQTIVHISGEPSVSRPPNPNYYQSDRDGFREILQTLYEISTYKASDPKTEDSTNTKLITNGLDNASAGIAMLNRDLEVMYHNSHAPVAITTGGKMMMSLLFPEHDSFDAWLEKDAKNKIKTEKIWQRVPDRLPGDNDRRIFDVIASYHKNSNAEVVIVAIDRTNDYNPEEDEFDFISFAAHELRGPITVIRGYLDVLQDELKPVLKDDQGELIERLIVTSNRLSSYVSNILNASRYDRRHMMLHLKEHRLRTIYNTISDDMELRAHSQNRILAVEIPRTLPTVAADENAISEVLSNLIDNAIKYSYEGGLVRVSARTVPGFIEISITDNGVGMPSNVVSNLFHKFYRSHRSRDSVAGTGIGLYICRAIVTSHGGTIVAQSVENEGSTFTFTLPIYDTVADKILAGESSEMSLKDSDTKKLNDIKNHSMFRS